MDGSFDDNSGYNYYGGAEGGLYYAQDLRLSKETYLTLAILQQSLAGGVIFGWQALLPVLYEYGVYAESCDGGGGGKLDPSYPCLKMRSKLALVFSIAGSATAVGALVAGLIMDYAGTRVARLFSSVIVVAGALMLAYAGPESIMWFPGLACLGFGGNGIQITSFHISNLFAGNERLVVSMITGSFAASSCLFTLMRLLYEKFGLDMRSQFLVYSGVCALVLVTSVVWPVKAFSCPEDLNPPEEEFRKSKWERGDMDSSSHSEFEDSSIHGYPWKRQESLDNLEPLLGLQRIPETEIQIQASNQLCLDLSNLPLRQQLVTPEWIGLLIFFNVHQLTSTYFLTAVGDQLECWACGCANRCWDRTCMSGDACQAPTKGRDWLTAFGIIYPLGFITTPVCGYLQDRYQLSTLLAFVNFCFLLWQGAAILPWMESQGVTLVIYSCARQFLYSFFFAAVGSTFGYENFGFLTGIANAVSAGVLMLNAPLYALTASHFTYTYGAFAGSTMLFFVYAIVLRRRFHRLRDQDAYDWDQSRDQSACASPRPGSDRFSSRLRASALAAEASAGGIPAVAVGTPPQLPQLDQFLARHGRSGSASGEPSLPRVDEGAPCDVATSAAVRAGNRGGRPDALLDQLSGPSSGSPANPPPAPGPWLERQGVGVGGGGGGGGGGSGGGGGGD